MLTKENIGLEWKRASHAAGFGMDYCEISPQKARALLNKDGQKDARLPSVGCFRLIGLNMHLTNRGGQYSIECMK